MPKIGENTPGTSYRAMVYHQGIPVAICPVDHFDHERLHLECGPLRFDRNARLTLSLSREGDPLQDGVQAWGVVEGHAGAVTKVLLDYLPDGLQQLS